MAARAFLRPTFLLSYVSYLFLVTLSFLVLCTSVGSERPVDAAATMTPTPESVKKTSFEYLYNHIFLPRKLSSADDATPKNEGLLLDFALHSLQRFLPDRHDAKAIEATPIAVLQILEQNAGVLISRHIDKVCFEMFELSPTDEAVMTTRGRLVRCFPTTAVEISLSDFECDAFQTAISKTLAKMSQQTLRETKEKQRASQDQEQKVPDNTTDPMIIIELFTSMLRGCGKAVSSQGIRKNTRDEIIQKGHKNPWRRSPMWLLIRVALQLAMTRHSKEADETYKEFMTFLMAQALHLANKQSKTSSEVLSNMSTKVSQRLSKLRSPSGGAWLSNVQSIVSQTLDTLSQRWIHIQERAEPSLKTHDLSEYNMAESTSLPLNEMDSFLRAVSRQEIVSDRPRVSLSSTPIVLSENQLPTFAEYPGTELSLHLLQIELWVANDLPLWIDIHLMKSDQPVKELKQLLETYHQKAASHYAGRPEALSRMILATGELWLAADKATVHELPLLANYRPQIPMVVWQALLLGSAEEMKRLKRIEDYITKREELAEKSRTPAVFFSFGESGSFAVEYYRQSIKHQQIKRDVENDAYNRREEKVEEFRNAKATYAKLMQRYAASECDVSVKWDDGQRVFIHPSSCRRCGFESKAKALAVSIHEWPLPKDELDAQATIFEMAVPETFSLWRDLTLYLIIDVLQSRLDGSATSAKSFSLKTYQPLKPWYTSKGDSRIQLRSMAKPNAVVHRHAVPVHSSGQSDVCLNSGLEYRFYDERLSLFCSTIVATDRLSDLCTFKLPERTAALGRFLRRTWENPDGETPNSVIASQHECPDYMSLRDFNALASMPYGHKIQWMSILTQLAMPKVDFNTSESVLFLLQISLQAGPQSSIVARSTHTRLCDLEFGQKMLDSLRKCVLRVQKNWESHNALWSFTFLAARLLPFVPAKLSQPFLDLLAQCREISYGWVKFLLARVEETSSNEQRTEFLRTAVTIAMVCADSLNVDDDHMRRVLHDSHHASILIECAIIINDNAELIDEDNNYLQGRLLDRIRLTTFRARPILVDEHATGSMFLSIATQRRWSYFRTTTNWTLSTGTDCWYTTMMDHLRVDLNILTGELLVNDLPSSRLPLQYVCHHDYKRLFKDFLLLVMPSTIPGMTFCTAQPFHGYTAHFGRQAEDLFIRLESDEKSFDLIPQRLFTGTLPDSFVNGYVHWYDNHTKSISFCPPSDPFPTESEEWRLDQGAQSWMLHRDKKIFVLSPLSGLGQRVAAMMAHLETSLHVHILYDEQNKRLEISLPRLQLQFFLSEGDIALRSRQFGNMRVDPNQSIGMLVGFRSKLVLRNDQNPPKRLLIIPEGELHFEKQGIDAIHDHIVVSVLPGTCRRVQPYQMDELLGRLVANTKVESKLYLAYLHALTSFYLPDPFLRQRGADMALDILRSASICAPMSLGLAARHTLDLLAALAPSRHYYPDGSRSMQNVVWSPDLNLATQDDRLFDIVQKILQRSSEVKFLFSPISPTTAPSNLIAHTTIELVQRALSRDSDQDKHLGDVIYHSRSAESSARAARATEIAIRAFRHHQGLVQPVTGGLAQYLYKLMASGSFNNQRSAPQKRELEYDSQWLRKPSTIIPAYWCRLHYAFQDNQQWLNKMELMVWLSTMAYSNEHDNQITQALLMMALSTTVAATALPSSESHDLSKGYDLRPETIEAAASPFMIRSKQGPEGKSRARTAKGDGKIADRMKREYGKDKKQAIHIFRDGLARQWPCQTPKKPSDYHMESYIDATQALKSVLPSWRMWWANRGFKQYLEAFVATLKMIPVESVIAENQRLFPATEATERVRGFSCVTEVFGHDAPDISFGPDSAFGSLVEKTASQSGDNEKLAKVIDFLESRKNLQYERRYLDELRQSLSSLEGSDASSLARVDERPVILQQHLTRCEEHHERIFSSFVRVMQPISGSGLESEAASPSKIVRTILLEVGFLPTVSPTLLLKQLKKSNWLKLSSSWKDAIVKYGLAIAALQKARRLIRSQEDPIDLLRELENVGHDEWNPHDYPEWLLMECESDITIRQVQQHIAKNMINPPAGDNAVMQLNMGEGKSSVIVPIVASVLSDGQKLVRIIVAKPQAKQMHQMLVGKLSGLLDRPVYDIPFSRDIYLDDRRAAVIHRLLVDCKNEGGVWLTQPEHLLSLQLKELESTLSNALSVAEHLRETRQFLDDFSRDVVDESDENFSVKFELVYTLGEQKATELSPERWNIAQEVLALMYQVSAEVKVEFPNSLEIDDRHEGKLPRVRILRRDAERMILQRIADHICETGMTGLPISRQPPKIRQAVHRYITEWELTAKHSEEVERSRFWNKTIADQILLLRGLLAGGILGFALSRKRWRVDYGLDETREKSTKLAVPYRAKDSPTPRSEFSHPDIVIVLTCLSYYYGGLKDQALFDSLEALLRSDNPDLEYQAWLRTAPTLPGPYKQLQGINLKDHLQCKENIFPHLRYSKAAIDYYLSRMVFPKECREFPYKLSASGWDLAKRKMHPTTGFSGTNDSKYTLPLDIKQLDIPEQSHTNALVLKNLLRPENSVKLMSEDVMAKEFGTKSLLNVLKTMDSRPRVLLDVGAQIIDSTNLDLARIWLDLYRFDEQTRAVVFFNDQDEIMALDKSGEIQEFSSSPYADQLGQCLVYLDEAHTRGIDLKLPADYQAAVTLGANVTKDRLVQACMRMRKLGKGQSVVFFVPRDIEEEIRLVRHQENMEPARFTVSDILSWAITETCKDQRRAVPIWLNQGLRFAKQQPLWSHLIDREEGEPQVLRAEEFREDDAPTLEMRYSPHRALMNFSSRFGHIKQHYAVQFQNRCEQFGLTDTHRASFDEEQERELAPEAEQERQVEKLPRFEPAQHQVHPGLEQFVLRGAWPTTPFQPAFKILETTSAAQYFDVSEFSNAILVTRDFAVTVNGSFGPVMYSDSFQRPVQWILTIRDDPAVLIIVSPYEVQELLTAIEQSKHVELRLYSAKVNLGYDSLDRLDLYSISRDKIRRSIPRATVSRLCQFAGQLYLSSFDDYIQFCQSLGLAWEIASDDVVLGPDGFIISSQEQGSIAHRPSFSKSPVSFLKALMTKIRQNSEHIERTHVGKILQGLRLLESDFEV
ncbi:hypothetical protein OPT61_g7683 [Boeremia exigua]|uniref:Uncharacterized protein n=1 Tax=Boeremia exigua TaxID=749465 RepID=A0ACC2I189_9PLEO|nr:hypothetical protein OPT61_g7683 [Boeremia exigua]